MIRVNKIAHATYETPDLDQQTEYYTEILGLTLVAKEKDAAYLASTVDHHSVVLRRGPQGKLRRVWASRSHRTRISMRSRSRSPRTAVKTQRKKDPEPSISDMVTFADPKGTIMQVFKRDAFSHQKFTEQGHRAAQARPRRLPRHRRQARHQVLLRRARLSRIRLDGGLLLVPALRSRPSHHQSDGDRLEPPLPHRLRAARLGRTCTKPATSSASTATSFCGDRAGMASATICSPITARRTA